MPGEQRRSLSASFDRATGGGDAALDEIAAAGDAVEDLLTQLRACPNSDEARQLLRNGAGACVGRLDRALEAGAASREPAERPLLAMIQNQVVGHSSVRSSRSRVGASRRGLAVSREWQQEVI